MLLYNSAGAVQAVPNETVVEGNVAGQSEVSSSLLGVKPEQTLSKITITVETIEKVSGKRSLIELKKGDTMEAYSKAEVPADITGKKVKVRVSVAGDERGRMIWIKTIEEIN